MNSESNAYALAGVDVDIEAEASRIMYEASKKTFENRSGKLGDVVTPFDDFAGLKMIDISQLPAGSFMSLGFDGAGTKVEIAERVNRYDTVAFDLMAMVCDDALIRGGETIVAGSVLDIKTLGTDDRFLPIIRQLADGYVAAAREANVAIINGEIAQMSSVIAGYGEFPFSWSAAAIWAARKEKLFTGDEMKAGDAIVMLREEGFRCNGLSLVRKIFREAHGDEWHALPLHGSTLGQLALTPSRIYSRFVVGLHGGFDAKGICEIHGVAHITGGGVPEKMMRILRRSGLGARLQDLFEPGAIVQYAQKTGNISDHDAYRAWNMGQGMALVTPEPDAVLAEAKRYGMEARIAGEIIAAPEIRIASKGTEAPGQELVFAVE
jgi:phosphoribosylformylglycinamidine cyclo-ligase